jgi:hypothetical protein
VEEVSTGELSRMEMEQLVLVLQHLKDRAVGLQDRIQPTAELTDPELERARLSGLQRELISVMPMMNLVRTLVKLEGLYRGGGEQGVRPGPLSKAKQAEIRVSGAWCVAWSAALTAEQIWRRSDLVLADSINLALSALGFAPSAPHGTKNVERRTKLTSH